MLLLDQIHTAVAKGKSFQTSPPPIDNADPEDPWKVQVAKDGPPKKHVWVSKTPLHYLLMLQGLSFVCCMLPVHVHTSITLRHIRCIKY